MWKEKNQYCAVTSNFIRFGTGDCTTPVTVRHKAKEKNYTKKQHKNICNLLEDFLENCEIVNGGYKIILKYFKINFLF